MTFLRVEQFKHEYVKAGYTIPDPIEGHMYCDVIVLSRNDV